MSTFGIDLSAVKERPRMPAGQDFELAIVKATPGIAKQPNKHSGVREPYVGCEIHPVHPEWADKRIYHNWSFSQGALEADDPTFSIVKFLRVIGRVDLVGPNLSSEDLQVLRFVGQIKYKEGDSRPQLARVMRGA